MPRGRYDHPDDDQEKLLDPAFHGYGRAATDARGAFSFHTIKPGAVPGVDGALQAPHINVSDFCARLAESARHANYFPDEPLNATDAVLECRHHATVAPR